MNRIKLIQRNTFNEAQQTFVEHLSGGKRGVGKPIETFFTPDGGLRGPFNAWLYSPVIGDAIQRLGEAIRFESSLLPRHRELAILTVAAHWQSAYEFWAHEKIARQEGVEDGLITSLRSGVRPDFKESQDALIYDLSREVILEHQASDHLYNEAVSRFGETGVVDLIILLGYYTLVSMTLNVFEVPAPAE